MCVARRPSSQFPEPCATDVLECVWPDHYGPMEVPVNNEMRMQGGSGADAPIEPLEQGRPDIMPNPPVDVPDGASTEGERPLDPDGGMLEEDMDDVGVNNSVSEENPPSR